MTIFFTSDTHFGHKNILKYCQESRGHLSDVEEHDQELIAKWNEKISPKDDVYHLGDFGFLPDAKLVKILDQPNGKKHLILGNHDHFKSEVASKFIWIKDYFKLKYFKQKIVLFHYPIESWDGKHRDTWHLHGHTHKNVAKENSELRVDVGVDGNNLYPYSFEEIKSLMEGS